MLIKKGDASPFKDFNFNQNLLLPPSLEELIDHGHITLKEAYLDGTKIEANANRDTFVWGKAIKYNRERIKGQLEDLWRYAEQVAREELEHNQPESFAEIDAEKVTKTIEKIDQALSGKEVDKKVKQKLNYARKKWPESLRNMRSMNSRWDNETAYRKRILMPPSCG